MLDVVEDGLALSKLTNDWCFNLSTPQTVERTEIIGAVQAYYQALGKKAPIVLVGQSPWQLIMLKTLLQQGLDRGLEIAVNQPSKDPFAPHGARWLWRELSRTLNEQTTRNVREKLAHSMERGPLDFWSTALKTVLADLPLIGPWSKLTPSLTEEHTQWTKQLELTAKNYFKGDSFPHLEQKYMLEFPFAVPDPVFPNQVRRELVNYAIGNQPGEIRAQVIANLMSPVVSSLYRFFAAPSDLDMSVAEQKEHELKLLGLINITELVFTQSLVGKLPFFEFLAKTVPSFRRSTENWKKVEAMLRLCQATPIVLPFEGVFLACNQPTIQKMDAAYKLHAEDGPALSFSDGFQLYSFHGVRINGSIVDSPTSITVERILHERNVEVRRIMIERFGHARFVKECGAKKIHEDQFGELYRKEFRNQEPLAIVKVKNRTPEPDGSYRDYFIRVPPTMKTAREAVAWTFHMSAKDYFPDEES